MVPICMVTEETLNQLPDDVRAYLRALRRRVIELERADPQQRIAELEAANRKLQVELDDLRDSFRQQKGQLQKVRKQLADTQAKLKTNSSNSSLPPSSDRFHVKRRPPPAAGQPRKKRGGQPGHPRQQRLLVPSDQVRETIPCKPHDCRRCGRSLNGSDPSPLRHQVAELPVVRPDVVEYQLHRLICPCCHTSTCGQLPAFVRGQFGPRLEAAIALLAGRYRLGVRPIAALAADFWGLDISPGMVGKLRHRAAEALLLPWVEVVSHVGSQNVNIDETPWREGKKRPYLWVVATPFAVLYHIAHGRGRAIAEGLLGKDYAGVATCDRLKSYWWIKRLQWCWAHLRRDFQAMIDRGNKGKGVGEELLGQSNTLFHLWHQVREGTLSRAGFQAAIKPVRRAVRKALQQGVACGCVKTAGTCRELLGHEAWLWTFVDVEGVEPTNNEAEREGRPGVLWRKTSGGTDSAHGSRFVERVLTVVHTCLRQGKNVLDYLVECIRAERHGRGPPRLLADIPP
jgi:transposase